jgi:hypothetical protein
LVKLSLESSSEFSAKILTSLKFGKILISVKLILKGSLKYDKRSIFAKFSLNNLARFTLLLRKRCFIIITIRTK